jgi:hypothetical protein
MDENNLNLRMPQVSEETCFYMLVQSPEGKRHAQFLLNSLRAFGGPLRDCPVLIFQVNPGREIKLDFNLENVYCIPIDIDPEIQDYWFLEKVFVGSKAEEIATGNVRSLVWLSTQCLILLPPVQLDLGESHDAAFRPVHIKNIGLAIEEQPDPFWKAIYRVVGVDECSYTVHSFVDGKEIRPYFNTHLFSVNPSRGILQIWLEYFREMISDEDFQSGPCGDPEHKIFLHQAILSALVTKMLDRERLRILPFEYSYPLHLHQEVLLHLRPESLNLLICPVYEGVYQHPATLNGLNVHEPLKTWILDNMPSSM